MRILAFHFVDGDAADAAMGELRTELDSAAHDLRTAGDVVDEVEGVVLGMTVENADRTYMIKVVSEQGGRLVADVPEEWTTSRPHS